MLNWRQSQGLWWKLCVLVGVISPLLTACSSPQVRGVPSSPTPTVSLSAGETLAAIGVKPQQHNASGAEDTPWRDRRVAFGLNNLLAESFYDTGKFRLIEEKDIRQHQLIEEMVDLFWSAPRPQLSDPELGGIGTRLEAALLAFGTIGYTRSSGQRFQVGPLGTYQQRLRVTVEVCLFEVATLATLCRTGEGRAQQEGVGLVYEFRQDRPDFEKSAAGRATKQAVTAAVQALVARIRFTP